MTEAEYIKYETDKARPAPETEAEDWRPCVKVRGPEGESRWIGITPLQFQMMVNSLTAAAPRGEAGS